MKRKPEYLWNLPSIKQIGMVDYVLRLVCFEINFGMFFISRKQSLEVWNGDFKKKGKKIDSNEFVMPAGMAS